MICTDIALPNFLINGCKDKLNRWQMISADCTVVLTGINGRTDYVLKKYV